MHRIQCSEVWGGIRDADLDVCTAGLTASLYSGACEGGKGGDIYFFSLCGVDMLTRIAVADVVGHGSEVSEISQWVYDAMAARMNAPEGDQILSDLNGLANARGLQAMTTAAVVEFYVKDCRLYFSYAGHPPLLVRRRVGGAWQPAQQQRREGPVNLPLGVVDETRYVQEQMPLCKGDRMFLYTDGLVEAPNAGGQLYGADRLMSVLAEAGGNSLMELKTAVLADVRRHAGGRLAHDDVTLMTIEVN